MRLTLRTLLAWMDDVLPADHQEEMGVKVRASGVARSLVERIRQVVARPGLAAPRVDGRGLAEDANTVAEFLDNVLPGDRLEAFERVCIDSDIHLAEAADCHALLAKLAVDPAVIEPLDRPSRKRLLDRVTEQVDLPPDAAGHEEAASLVLAVRQAGRGRSRAQPPAASRGDRDNGKATWVHWLSALAGLLLLVVLVALLGRLLMRPDADRREVAGIGDRNDQAPAAPAEPAAARTIPPTVPDGPRAGDSAVGAGSAAVVRPGPAAAAGDESTTAEPVPPDAAAIGATVPLPRMDLAGEEAGQPAEPEDAPAAPPVAEAPAAPPWSVAEGGPLLRHARPGDDGGWEAMAPGDRLAVGEKLMAPVHAHPRLICGDVSIRLHPGTLATLAADRDGTPRLELVFGRAVAWTEAAEAAVAITAGGLVGVASLGPRQPLGVAVELFGDGGDDAVAAPPGSRSVVHVTGGSRWRQTEPDGGPPGRPLAGLQVEQPLPPRSGIGWNSADPAVATLLPDAGGFAWMGRDGPVDRLDAHAAAALAAALAGRRPVEQSLQLLAADRRVENRMAAAATLALLGDYGELVGLLCEERPGERLAEGSWERLHFATVPLALARGANAAARLRQEFAARAPAGHGDEVFMLARLLPAGQANDPLTLVDKLEDEALVVRRYALLNLVSMFPTGLVDRLEYRPDRAAALNERGVAWWRRRVTDEEGADAAAGRAADRAAPSP